MQNSATSRDNARFWVRPYEFEGDGSLGVATDVASLEVAGKTRTFWLKMLENRLFFREVGRDESWNFGAIEELNDSEKSDLPMALANVLANENYGRVVLPGEAPRPCLYLVGPDSRFWFGSPQNQLQERGVWSPHKATRFQIFLERPARYFKTLVECNSEHGFDKEQELFAQLYKLPRPILRPKWIVGSEQEWRRVVTAFFHFWWPQFREEFESEDLIEWQLWSAWAMEPMELNRFSSWGYWIPVSYSAPPLRRRAQYLIDQFCWIGAGKTKATGCWGQKIDFGPHALRGTVSSPTHHEILEAHVFLRDWINQRLPAKQARRWLEFP